MKDLHNNIHVARGISPAAAGTDNTAMVSQVCDRKGYEAVEFLINIGANTDSNATFAVLFEDSDDNVTYGAVADKDLLGTEALAGFQYDDDNEVRKIGYTGGKRYVRVTITPSGNDSGNIYVAGTWLLGHPWQAPTINPPV